MALATCHKAHRQECLSFPDLLSPQEVAAEKGSRTSDRIPEMSLSGLDASPKLLMQTFNGSVVRALFHWLTCKAQKPIACFFKAVGNGAVPQAPFAHYGRARARA
jgi:hypothetical protein